MMKNKQTHFAFSLAEAMISILIVCVIMALSAPLISKKRSTGSSASSNIVINSTNLPKGAIVIWSGDKGSIPRGWVICDGKNNTPDLRDKFIMGGEIEEIGETGGLSEVTLTEEQMASHSHSMENVPFYDESMNVNCQPPKLVPFGSNSNWNRNRVYSSFASTYAGSGKAHENRPPYYALFYIMKE